MVIEPVKRPNGRSIEYGAARLGMNGLQLWYEDFKRKFKREDGTLDLKKVAYAGAASLALIVGLGYEGCQLLGSNKDYAVKTTALTEEKKGLEEGKKKDSERYMRDIEEQKKAVETMRKQKEKAEKALIAQKRLVENMKADRSLEMITEKMATSCNHNFRYEVLIDGEFSSSQKDFYLVTKAKDMKMLQKVDTNGNNWLYCGARIIALERLEKSGLLASFEKAGPNLGAFIDAEIKEAFMKGEANFEMRRGVFYVEYKGKTMGQLIEDKVAFESFIKMYRHK